MRTIYTVIICFLFVTLTNAQERYLTKNGAISFFSSAVVKDFRADNNQVLSIIDAGSGQMAISILMKSFMFEKALMQEHFNENYVESDKFPKATFRGDIVDFENITDLDTKVAVKGIITIHGVSKEIVIGAKKFTLKTCLHKVRSVSVNVSLLLSEFLGETAALLINALTGLPSRTLCKSRRVLSKDI